MLALIAVTGCTVGTPVGFSNGDHWTFPLVGPLEDGLLVTPVSVHGHGPYLFAIDPDANVTAIDKQVAVETALQMGIGPRRIDETDTGQPRIYAELLDLKVGGLTINRRDAMVFPVGFYDTEGRHLSGILGRDVLADSLVFGFDRDQGIATLSTIKAFTPPPDAVAIKYQNVSPEASAVARVGTVTPSRLNVAEGTQAADVVPVPRRLAAVQIGDATFTMHLDLGAAVSQLREPLWSKAGIAPAAVKLRLVDEAASAREVSTAGISTDVRLGDTKTALTTFVPYIEKRFVTESVDGALGLDSFQPFAVYANWDRGIYYLKARGDAASTTTARLGRWAAALPTCPHLGCVTAELAATDAGVMLSVARDAEAANRSLEVLLGVTSARDTLLAPLVVELPSGTDKLTSTAPEGYMGKTLAVLDVSPFPRECAGGGGCVFSLGVQLARDAQPAPQGPPPPTTVLVNKLHRLTGDPAIPPSDDVQKAAAGTAIAVAIVRVCLTADGKVDAAKVVKSSGVPAYDAQLLRTIQATWTFEPVEADGKPAPVCTQVTFVPHG